MLPGTWRSADPLIPRQGEDPHAVVAGVTRPHLSLVQRAPRGPVRSAGMLMPKAARERLTTPPAGTALAPMPRNVSGAGPLLSENRYVTVSETIVNRKVTPLSTVIARSEATKQSRSPAPNLDCFASLAMTVCLVGWAKSSALAPLSSPQRTTLDVVAASNQLNR